MTLSVMVAHKTLNFIVQIRILQGLPIYLQMSHHKPKKKPKNIAGLVIMETCLFCNQETGDRYLNPAPETMLLQFSDRITLWYRVGPWFNSKKEHQKEGKQQQLLLRHIVLLLKKYQQKLQKIIVQFRMQDGEIQVRYVYDDRVIYVTEVPKK